MQEKEHVQVTYSITIRAPLKTHGMMLHKNLFEDVYRFFEQKKWNAYTGEKRKQVEFFLELMNVARTCGAQDVIPEVVAERNESDASITFSFPNKEFLENFEKGLMNILTK